MKLQPGANPEGDRLAIPADLPGLGDATDELGEILRLEHHQAIVEIRGDLAAGELEDLGGIERDDVADVLRHDERVARRRGLGDGCGTEHASRDRQEQSME